MNSFKPGITYVGRVSLIILNCNCQSRSTSPCGPREPGVGAELDSSSNVEVTGSYRHLLLTSPNQPCGTRSPSLDLDCDLDRCDVRSIGSGTVATPSMLSDDDYDADASDVIFIFVVFRR